MAKTKISEWSATPANNTDIDNINIAEGCAPSGINDAIREMMAQIKDLYAGTSGDIIAVAAGGTGVGTSTGSGSNVLSTSPTLVTPALGTPSALVGTNITGTATSFNINGTVGATTPTTGAFTTVAASGAVTLSGGTANGVAYLNGSKVVTSGSALTFDGSNLTLTGNLYMTGGSIAFDDERYVYSYAGGSLGQYMSGVYYDGSGLTQRFFINNSEQMRLTSTGLGIGTSSPAAKLESFITSTSTPALRLRYNSSSYYADHLMDGNGNYVIKSPTSNGVTSGNVLLQAASNLFLYTNNTESARLDSAGNLGLGVTPTNAFTSTKSFEYQSGGIFPRSNETNFTFNATQNSGASWIYGATNSASLFQIKPASFVWQIAGSGTAGNAITFTQAMTLTAGGGLLVGSTSTPASGSSTVLAANSGGGGVQLAHTGSGGGGLYVGLGGGGIATYTYTGAVGSESYTERARIDSSGNLFVNQTSQDGAEKVGISYDRAGSWGMQIRNTTGTTAATTYIAFKYVNTQTGYIASGDGSTTQYVTTSDYRLKNSVAPITGALAKVAQLKPVTYKWNTTGSDGEGFIAHELAEVCPLAVSGDKDAVDADGNPVYQGIDTSFLVATLTAAIQEQQAIIESLKARLDAANL